MFVDVVPVTATDFHHVGHAISCRSHSIYNNPDFARTASHIVRTCNIPSRPRKLAGCIVAGGRVCQ